MLYDGPENSCNFIGGENLSTSDSLGCHLQSTIWCQFNVSRHWVCDVTLSLIYVFVDNRQFLSDAMPMHMHHTSDNLRYVDVRTNNCFCRMQVTVTTTSSCVFIVITYHNIIQIGRRIRMLSNYWACSFSIKAFEVVFQEVMIIIRCLGVKRITVVLFNGSVVCLLDIILHWHSSVVSVVRLKRSFASWRWL